LEITSSFLSNCGMSEKEIEMYYFLNLKGSAKISIIAKNMNMHKMQAYRQIEKMERNGFVFRTLGSPRLYSSVPIEKIIRTRMYDLKLEYQGIEHDSNEIIEQIKKIRPKNKFSADKMEIIQGAERTQLAIFEMMKRSLTDFCGMNTLEYYIKLFGLRMSSWPNNESDEFKKRMRIRGIIHLPIENIQDNPSSVEFIKKVTCMHPCIEFRFLRKNINPTPVFAIRDNEELVLITNEGEENKDFKNLTRTAIWTTNERLVVLVQILFEYFWENSIKLQSKM